MFENPQYTEPPVYVFRINLRNCGPKVAVRLSVDAPSTIRPLVWTVPLTIRLSIQPSDHLTSRPHNQSDHLTMRPSDHPTISPSDPPTSRPLVDHPSTRASIRALRHLTICPSPHPSIWLPDHRTIRKAAWLCVGHPQHMSWESQRTQSEPLKLLERTR